MLRVNIDILGINELKWVGMGKFNSDDCYIYYCGQEYLRRNRVTLIINKGVWNAVLGCNLKNDSMISVCFQGKPFNITVIQVCVSTTNAEEAELNGLPWRRTEIILSFLRLHPSTAFRTLPDHDFTPFLLREFLPTVVDIIVIWVKFTHSGPF